MLNESFLREFTMHGSHGCAIGEVHDFTRPPLIGNFSLQARAISPCSVLFGPHGAAMAHMIWLRGPGTYLHEFVMDKQPHFFMNMAQLTGTGYSFEFLKPANWSYVKDHSDPKDFLALREYAFLHLGKKGEQMSLSGMTNIHMNPDMAALEQILRGLCTAAATAKADPEVAAAATTAVAEVGVGGVEGKSAEAERRRQVARNISEANGAHVRAVRPPGSPHSPLYRKSKGRPKSLPRPKQTKGGA